MAEDPKLKTYMLVGTWEVYAQVFVEATSLEEAMEIASADDFERPIVGDYVNASFQVFPGEEPEEEEEV